MGQFQLPPVPRFPREGNYTREVLIHTTNGDNRPARMLETSTPGLRGQSGGPVFDRQGTVWGIQSHTRHLPLGFRPRVEVDGKQTVENQFLNVGMTVHPQVIVDFLTERGIAFAMSDY